MNVKTEIKRPFAVLSSAMNVLATFLESAHASAYFKGADPYAFCTVRLTREVKIGETLYGGDWCEVIERRK